MGGQPDRLKKTVFCFFVLWCKREDSTLLHVQSCACADGCSVTDVLGCYRQSPVEWWTWELLWENIMACSLFTLQFITLWRANQRWNTLCLSASLTLCLITKKAARRTQKRAHFDCYFRSLLDLFSVLKIQVKNFSKKYNKTNKERQKREKNGYVNE